jgi:hypothetical protein
VQPLRNQKFGPWPRKCEFKVDFGKGVIDRHEEIAQLALDYNVVTKSSSVTHEYLEYKWVGFNKFCDAIKDDTQLALELEKKIRDAREFKLDAERAAQLEKIKSSADGEDKKKSKKDDK